MNYAVEVYIDSKNQNLNRKFTYLVTSEQFAHVQIGTAVIVPLAKAEQLGYVASKTQIDPQKIDYELKYIIDINQEQSLTTTQLYLLAYLIQVTLCPFIEALDLVSPRKQRAIYRDHRQLKLREKSLVDAYLYTELATDDSDLLQLSKVCENEMYYLKADVLKQLALQGLKLSEYKWRKAQKIGLLTKQKVKHCDLKMIHEQELQTTLTTEQIASLDQINECCDDILLLGKTGSGKTEVIKYLIDTNPNYQQILILEPNNLLAMQIYERFKEEFVIQVCLYNPNVDTKEMQSNYELIKSGEIRIIVSTAKGIFAPFKNLDLIVVDEEHEQNYYNRLPNFQTHELIRALQKINNLRVVLMSATPSFETIARSQRGHYQLIKIPSSYSEHETKIEIQQIEDYEKALTVDAIMAIKQSLEANKKVIIYHNVRGYASSVECENCLRVPVCPNCQENLKYYQDNTLRCHNCNFKVKFTNHCSRCNRDNSYKLIGIGAEQVIANLELYFNDYSIHQIDSSTSQTERQHFLKEFRESKPQILVGTNLILHGIDFNDIDLAIVTNVDYSIRSGSLYQEEQIYQNLVQLMGRIGKGLELAKLLIQTKKPDHNVFSYLLSEDYLTYYHFQYEQRKLLGKYPFQQKLAVNILHQDFKSLMQIQKRLSNHLNNNKQLNNLISRQVRRKRIANDFYYNHQIELDYQRGTDLNTIRQLVIKFNQDGTIIYFDGNYINAND